MAKAKKDVKIESSEKPRIDIKDLKVGTTYRNHADELVKIRNMNDETQMMHVVNLSGQFNQWMYYKDVKMISVVR